MDDAVQILAGGLDHPEGVAWDPTTNRVYAGGEAGQVYAIGLDGSVDIVASTGGFVLGLAVDGDGLVYACDVGRGHVVRVDPTTGDVAPHGVTNGDAMRAPNWLAFDSSGGLFVTDSGDWGTRQGRIWRIEPDRSARLWSDAPALLANGCALDAEGHALFVVETNLPGISRIPIEPDGSAGPREVWVELPGTVPDGIALVADGSLLVGCQRPDAVLRVDRNRRVSTLVEDRSAQTLGAPANIAFVGSELDRIVTSNLARWHVTIADVGLQGRPLARPSLRAAAAVPS